ncbi:MAG TPA: DNA methyltransferase [Xanthobacteraceae bacterium]|jgi:DNA modification methylase|nr:DNA methyltransferase [Xanthobacteraceae bacterium]
MINRATTAKRRIETHSRVSDRLHSATDGGVGERPGPRMSWAVDMVPPESLKPAKRNARTHSKKQIRQIAESMARFGFTNPVLIDDRGRIVAGHARNEAAKLLRLKQIPIIRLSHLTETEVRAYMLADNKLAEKAGWDREMLATELEELQVALPEIGLDLDITGFDPGEVDSIFADHADEQDNPADQIPNFPDEPVAKAGDLFVLGHHRLLVGDARDSDNYVRLLGSRRAEMAFLDPPYNVKVQGHVGGRGRVHHREFKVASGEMTPAQFVRFLQEVLALCARYTIDGGITYVCMDWRHARDLLEAGASVYDELKNICVWVKTTPGQGSFYRSQHELVFIYKRGRAPHLNTFELGQHGRSRSNVWTYAGANTFRAGRMDELKMHPTVKPVALIADAMRDCSRRGAIILDAFAGSGSTILAAEQIGRRAFCIEIDPRYADVAITRWQRYTRKDAVLASTGLIFDEVAEARANASERGADHD